MTPQEIETIDAWRQDLHQEVVLELLVAEDGGNDPDMEAFAEDLSTLAPLVRWKPSDDHPLFAPGFRIGENLFFQMVPSQRELPPFLQALALLDGRSLSVSDAVRKSLAANELPAILKVFVAPTCPHCPAVVQQLLGIAAESERITLHVIDGARFSEAAKRADVQAVPTIVLEDRFRWTGTVDSEELAEMIRRRDPSTLGTASLRNLIESGNAQGVAEMMLASGIVYPPQFDLLCHERWSVRLGAMVVMEFIADENPALAAEAADPLWQRFPEAPDPVKGDLLHVLGETGPASLITRLQTVGEDDSYAEDVREAAREAGAAIRDRR